MALPYYQEAFLSRAPLEFRYSKEDTELRIPRERTMKRMLILVSIILGLASAAFAGDVATLVNLGFSPDSGYFMFGFYGLDMAAGKPYAEIYVVDTKKNDFVRDGVYKGLYSVNLEPGWDASGAFYKLLSTTLGSANKYKIDHLQQGRLIYLSINGEEAGDALSFKDFKTQAQWDIRLIQQATEKDGAAVSSFGIELSIVDTAGKKTALSIGNPQIKRKDVLDYTMRQILVAPDGKTVVILVERSEKLGASKGIRYMVETFRLP
jgi:predicted secreted protein